MPTSSHPAFDTVALSLAQVSHSWGKLGGLTYTSQDFYIASVSKWCAVGLATTNANSKAKSALWSKDSRFKASKSSIECKRTFPKHIYLCSLGRSIEICRESTSSLLNFEYAHKSHFRGRPITSI